MLTFSSKFPQNSRFRLLQILANTNGNSNGNTNADAKTNMNTHSYSNLPQMGPWELRPYRGEGLRSAQCSCCNPPQLFFCAMYFSIKINACIACIRNMVLYDIQCQWCCVFLCDLCKCKQNSRRSAWYCTWYCIVLYVRGIVQKVCKYNSRLVAARMRSRTFFLYQSASAFSLVLKYL